MSVSPSVSAPKTPDDSCNKRPRSPTPPPMVGGLEELGFRLRAGLIKYPATGALYDDSKDLREEMAEYMSEELIDKIAKADGCFEETVEIVNALFEIAASLTTVAPAVDADQQAKLDALYNYAIGGLDLIGGAEAPDIQEDTAAMV